MPGIPNTRLYQVCRTLANSRREELEVYEEVGTVLPHCLQYRTHVLRSYYPEIIRGILEELEILVASGCITCHNPFLDIVHFEGSYFCVIKLEIRGNRTIVRMHVHIE